MRSIKWAESSWDARKSEMHSRPYSGANMKKKNHLFKYTRKKCAYGDEVVSILLLYGMNAQAFLFKL